MEIREIQTRYKYTFAAQDENGGNHQIEVWVGGWDPTDRLNPDAELDDLEQYRTKDGELLNWIGRGKYQKLTTGEVLTSSDPTAP
jgi:hypothetical protein